MRTHFFTLVMALLTASLFAQITGSDAELFDKPGGKRLLALGADIQLYTGAADGAWFYSRVKVMVSKAELEEGIISAGAEIFNLKGESLGNLEANLKIVEKAEALGRKNRDKYQVILQGYVLKTRLKENSHPELALEEILQSKGQTTDALNEWIRTFKAQRHTKNGMIQYVLFEENYTLEDEQSFRIILHYKDASRLYAVSTHRQTIYLPKVKAQLDDQEIHHYFPANKPTDADLNSIKETAIGFLAL